MNVSLTGRQRRAWERVESRYEAYALLLPGDPSFVCQPKACDAHCCRKFSVSVGERERERMERLSEFSPVEFLECEDGRPIELPLARPYILRRAGDGCALLGPDLACTGYAGRPDACRQYPHQVVFVDTGGNPLRRPGPEAAESVNRLATGQDPGDVMALLLRHVECPGFTGPALGRGDWGALLVATFQLQNRPA